MPAGPVISKRGASRAGEGIDRSMSDKVRKHKERASRMIAKGKYDDALEEYLKAVKIDPRDLSVRQKLAETYARMGKTQSAIREYQSVAGAYAADGLLLKAIAINKVILNLDPRHTETQGALAELYARKRGDYSSQVPAASIAMPEAMNAARGGARRPAARITGRASREEVMAALEAAKKKPQNQSGGPPPPPSLTQDIDVDAIIDVDGDSGVEILSVDEAGADIDPVPNAAAASAIMSLVGAAQSQQTEGERPPTGGIELNTDFDIDINASSDEGAASIPTVDLSPADAVIEADAGALLPPSTGREPDPTAPLATLVGEAIDSAEEAAEAHAPAHAQPATIETNEEALAALGDLTADAQLPPDESLHDDDDMLLELEEPSPVQADELPPIPLFSDLSPQAFITFTERMGLRPLAANERLIAEGDRGSSMFIVVQGRVKVVREQAGEDKELLLAELGEGAFFGEMALLSDAPRTASVIAIEDTMVFEISRELLDDIVAEHESVALVMKRFYKNRLLTNLLRTSPVFAPFTAPEKKSLIEKFKSRSVKPGEFILTQDKPGDGLYVILSGRCEVSIPDDDTPSAAEQNGTPADANGSRKVLAQLREGDVFGEMSMLFQTNASASVTAVTPSIVLRLPKKRFQELIMTHPQVLETLSKLSDERLSQNEDVQRSDDEDILANFLM